MSKPVEFVTDGNILNRYLGPGGDVVIPDGIAVIGTSAFSYDVNVTSVTIPDSVRCISTSAFFGCTGMKSIDIPDSVECIHIGAFEGCSSLKAVSIPKGATEIRENAFKGCPDLIIHAPAKSRAEKYARENGIAFRALD